MAIIKTNKLFNEYGSMTANCLGESISLHDYFTNLADGAEVNVIDEFSDWVEDGSNEEEIAYNAFVTALKDLDNFSEFSDDFDVHDDERIIISFGEKILFDGSYGNL